MSKRTFSDFLTEGDSLSTRSNKSPRLLSPSRRSPSPKRSNTTTDLTLNYPNTSQPPRQSIPFQQPNQIISFSYTSTKTLEFTNSALRYLADPPAGAQLNYGYEQWVRKPEQKARIDGLLRAFSKARSGNGPSLQDVEIVAWRGVMTKCVNCFYVHCHNSNPVLD